LTFAVEGLFPAKLTTVATEDRYRSRLMAEAAARRAGITVGPVGDVDGLTRINRLFDTVWGGGGQDAVPVNMLKALAHTGNYVAGAWRSGALIGAAVGFAHGPDHPALHSHIAGVMPAAHGTGVGYALKLHQAAWALDRGLTAVTWTFDPLIRRNARFNLVKLGGRIEAYYPDFYGPMADGINDGDMTDRCLLVWDLEGGIPASGTAASVPAGGVVVLSSTAPGAPLTRAADPATRVILCQTPPDVVELRRDHPDAAREWRLALRATLGQALASGAVVSGLTAAGHYVVERTGG
jgi:predicted GNAT superfamily acetyltransferase